MRSTHRPRRAAAAALAAGLVAALVVAACSDADDTVGTSAPTTGAIIGPTTTAPTTGPSTTAAVTTAAVTEPAVPTLDDTAAVGGSRLYSVDLTTGAATTVGRIGGEEVGVLGLAFAPDAGPSTVYGLTDVPELITFDAADPGTLVASVPITGVAGGSTLLAIDLDPADGRLLALSDAGVLYAVDPATGAATAIGDGLGGPLADPGVGFDVDPAGGLIRVDVATGEQLLVDPAGGALAETAAGPLVFDPDDANAAATPRVVAIAHAETGLYGIDVATGSLVRQDPPDDGVLTTVGALGIDLTDGASLDIATTGGPAVALLAVPG